MVGAQRSNRMRYQQDEIENLLSPIYLLAGDVQRGEGNAGPDPVAPVLRAISSSQQRDAFTQSLSKYITQKDSEIERVCRDNYTDFLASTEKLLKARKGTVSLRSTLTALSSDIQSKGAVVASAKRDLLENNRVANNIDETVQTLQACLKVLDLANKISRLISVDKNYYAALRSLDDLLAIHLKPLLSFGFAQHMLQTLPLTRLQVRAEVTTEFKAWLFRARESGKELGRKAIDQHERRAKAWKEDGVASSLSAITNSRSDSDLTQTFSGLSRTPLNGPVELGVSERVEYHTSLLDDESEAISFRPLYQCIHIYDTLDALEDLQKSYQTDRSSQASLILSESQSIQPFSLEVLSSLLEEIVGFFIIEAHVLRSTSTGLLHHNSKFRTSDHVGELWTVMSERLAHVITSGLAGNTDPEMHLAVKSRLLATVQTLQGFGYATELLNEILAQFLRRYSTLLSKRAEVDIRHIVEDDDCQPMVLNEEQDRDKIISASYLPSSGMWSVQSIKSMNFPFDLPFSPTYPMCCVEITRVIEEFRQFSDGAISSQQAGDEMLRDALDRLLITTVVDGVTNKVKQTSNLPGLAQIIGNMEFFNIAAEQISAVVLLVGKPLEAGKYLQTASRQAVIKIISVVSRQLDGFFEDARYDWLARGAPRPRQHNRDDESSAFLQDIVAYLSMSMDNQLANLSPVHRNEVYRGALKHCSDTLMSFLTDKNPSRMSDNGLAYFAADVRFMTALASNLPAGVEDVFAEISQIISLLESDSPAQFLDKDVRQLGYNDITARRLRPVMNKLVLYYNSIDPMRLSARERKRKAEMESVMRALNRSSQ